MENTKANFRESNEVEFEFKLLREKAITEKNETEEKDGTNKKTFKYEVSRKKMEKYFIEVCNQLSEGKRELILIGRKKSAHITIGLFSPRFNLREEFKIARKKDLSTDDTISISEWIFRQLSDNGYKSIRVKYLERE